MFECKSSIGCARLKSGASGECDAARLKNGSLCLKSDPNSPKFNQAYADLVAGTKRENPPQVRKIYRNENITINNQKYSDFLEIKKHINECKYRSIKSTRSNENGVSIVIHTITNDDGSTVEYGDCGCGMNRCALGKGNTEGYVNHDDCQKCVVDRGLVTLDPPAKTPGFGDPSPGGPLAAGQDAATPQAEPSLRDGM